MMLILPIALLLSTALAQSAPAEQKPASGDDTIVVTAKRLHDAQAALAECLARHCPPKEEIEASLSYAEQQFLDGDYEKSRRTLLDARHRNAKYAGTLPVEVADLMRANGTLARMNGYTDAARIDAIDSLDALKSGLETGDARILMQRLAVGDQFAREGNLSGALGFYDAVSGQALRSGLVQVEGHALLRKAVLLVAVANVRPGEKGEARRAIRELASLKGDDLASFRAAAQTLTQTLADWHGSGREAIKAAAAGTLATSATQDPVLLYWKRIDIPQMKGGVSLESVTQWANITFLITPDGSVRDIEAVDRSPGFDDHWVDAVRKSLASRVYRPVAAKGGVRRIERYSLVHDLIPAKWSRSRARALTPRIEVTDITPAPSG